MFPEGLTMMLCPFTLASKSDRFGESGTSNLVSVGVGGVTVVTGVDIREDGGVSGLVSVSSASTDLAPTFAGSAGAGWGGGAGVSSVFAISIVLLLLSGLVKPANDFLSGLVLGLLLLEEKTSRNFLAGDLLLILPMLPLLESGPNISALSVRPGLDKEGTSVVGGLLGEGDCSGF